jgi:hypothetical protein
LFYTLAAIVVVNLSMQCKGFSVSHINSILALFIFFSQNFLLDEILVECLLGLLFLMLAYNQLSDTCNFKKKDTILDIQGFATYQTKRHKPIKILIDLIEKYPTCVFLLFVVLMKVTTCNYAL